MAAHSSAASSATAESSARASTLIQTSANNNSNTNASAIGQKISEEYKIWKKASPFLYDVLLQYALEHPSLNVEFLPEHALEGNLEVQALLIGTHATYPDQNALIITEVRQPSEDSEIDIRKFVESATTPGTISGIGISDMQFIVKQAIAQDDAVLCASYMPQQPNVIAAKTNRTPDVLVFERSKHPNKPDRGLPASPDIRLQGHEREGFGLAWNPCVEGELISGSDDKVICMWDMGHEMSEHSTGIAAKSIFRGHTDVVEDVQWNGKFSNFQFASGGGEGAVIVWDTRNDGQWSHKFQAHLKEVNSIAFSLVMETILAAGSVDGTISIWDLRNTSKRLHTLEGHQDSVVNLIWAPLEWKDCGGTVLASSSADRRVCVWDLSRIGQQQDSDDAMDGPPELIFIHGGHTAKVSDVAANPLRPWQFASVADDSIVQVWTIAESALPQPLVR